MPQRKTIRLAPPSVQVEYGRDGVIFLRSPDPLQPFARCTTEKLTHWANSTPTRVFLAKRGPDGNWKTITYEEAVTRVRRIAQALLDRSLSADRPVVILSGNDIEHALLALAAQHVGILYAPISPAYSLMSSDFVRLKHILSVLRPGLIFVSDADPFSAALAAVSGTAIDAASSCMAELVTVRAAESWRSTPFSELECAKASPEVDDAHVLVNPDTIAKILYTSGSTALPEGVINTQRMLCCNQQMMSQAFPFLNDEPPVLVDWLPWHHTFGGNFTFGMNLFHGGTLYIDDGRPIPGCFDETIRNLRDAAPTAYFNVPKAYDALISVLRADPEFRGHFFSRMKILFYAAASLSVPAWTALEQLAYEALGEYIPMLSSLGSTETAPALTCATWNAGRPGVIGLPLPGVETKLVPSGNKLELLARGSNITPGYWREPEKTRVAFDEEGFYKMGDAVRFADPSDPLQGLEFDGRIAEDFKLSTGTWVNVGRLRLEIIKRAGPLVRDVVIAGHDRDYVSGLIFPDVKACRDLCQELPRDASPGMIFQRSEVQKRFQNFLDLLASENPASASHIKRAILLEEPPSIDANEITDKGSINQRAVLDRRAALVEELYQEPLSPRVLVAASTSHL